MVPKTDPSFLNLYFSRNKKKGKIFFMLAFLCVVCQKVKAWGTTDPNALLQPKKEPGQLWVLYFHLNWIGANPQIPFFANNSFFFLFFTIFLSSQMWYRKMVILQSRFEFFFTFAFQIFRSLDDNYQIYFQIRTKTMTDPIGFLIMATK